MRRRLGSVWERVSLYLPVLLMGVLALGTYWLVRSTPVFTSTPASPLAGHEPDYFVKNFSLHTFDRAGGLRGEVLGIAARHFPDTDRLEIDRPRIRSWSEQGDLTTATAKRALTNGDASEVQLFGDALVVRQAAPGKAARLQPQLEYRSEFLHAFMNTERIQSHKPVELVRGRDRFAADTMVYDNVDQVLILKGRVKGTLIPGAAP